MCPGSSYRIYTVRVVSPDGSKSELRQFVRSEDDALDLMAVACGYPGYRAWQAEHPEEAGWTVVVEVKDS